MGSGREKDKESKDKMNFLSSNIPIPSIVKRKDKEKYKNGEKKDLPDKKSDKKDKHKQERDKEKENRNGTNSNRNSAILNSDGENGGEGVTQSQSTTQNQIDMKIIVSNKNSHHIDIVNNSTISDPLTIMENIPDGEGKFVYF